MLLVLASSCYKSSMPTCSNSKGSKTIQRDFYSLCFDLETKQPTWVLQVVDSRSFSSSSSECLADYRPDLAIPIENQASAGDYKGAQWIISNYLFSFDPDVEELSSENPKDRFFFSVTSPQNPEFHKGYWKKFRSRVEAVEKAKLALFNYNIAVLSGPLFLTEDSKKRRFFGSAHIPVPTHFFQVVVPSARPDDIEVYIVPNENIDMSKPLNDFKVPLEDFEKRSGIRDVADITQRLITPGPIL